MHLEILLEERSMENTINAIMAGLTGTSTQHTWQTHPHQGKAHLLKQLPQKLRAYSRWLPLVYDDYRIIILVDQDQENCRNLKKRIVKWAEEAGVAEHTAVRIVVTELEAWFLGDAQALERAFPKLVRLRIGGKAAYRQPDGRPEPAADLDNAMKEVGYDGYHKVIHSAEISRHLNLERDHNHSQSFRLTLATLRNLLT